MVPISVPRIGRLGWKSDLRRPRAQGRLRAHLTNSLGSIRSSHSAPSKTDVALSGPPRLTDRRADRVRQGERGRGTCPPPANDPVPGSWRWCSPGEARRFAGRPLGLAIAIGWMTAIVLQTGLVVLRHKTRRMLLLNRRAQYGHLGSALAIATIKV
jgi:hypothetical protein